MCLMAVSASAWAPILLHLFQVNSRPVEVTQSAEANVWARTLIHAASAGPTEEIVCLALPVAVARLYAWPPAVTVGVLLALRAPFHLYYGWGFLMVVGWVPLAWWVYTTTGNIWPMILAHSAYDVVLVLGELTGNNAVAAAVTATATLAGLAAATATYLRRRPRPAT